jgi:hypothetical protein
LDLGGGGGLALCRDRLGRDCRGLRLGILDAVYVRLSLAKLGFLRLACRALGKTQVSASSCYDYPLSGGSPGSGHIGFGLFVIQGMDEHSKKVQG